MNISPSCEPVCGPRCPRRCRRRVVAAARQRGSVYLAVLGAAMLVALIGVSGVLVNRVQYRTATATQQAAEADLLARSAIEWAISQIDFQGGGWSHSTHDAWTSEQVLGSGTISFKFIDRKDGNLSNNDAMEPVRLVGRGRSGAAMRMCSVELILSTNAPEGFTFVAGSWRREVEQP